MSLAHCATRSGVAEVKGMSKLAEQPTLVRAMQVARSPYSDVSSAGVHARDCAQSASASSAQARSRVMLALSLDEHAIRKLDAERTSARSDITHAGIARCVPRFANRDRINSERSATPMAASASSSIRPARRSTASTVVPIA